MKLHLTASLFYERGTIMSKQGSSRKSLIIGIITVSIAILGTIDSDYRGEVGAIIINHSKSIFIIKPNDRIAQAVVCPIIRAEWCLTDELSETAVSGCVAELGMIYYKNRL